MAMSMGTGCFTFKDRKSHCLTEPLQHYYLPADWARELFKPSKDGETLVVRNEKIILDLDVVFFIDVCMMGVCLCIFCLHSDDIIGPWTPTPRAIFFTRVFIRN